MAYSAYADRFIDRAISVTGRSPMAVPEVGGVPLHANLKSQIRYGP